MALRKHQRVKFNPKVAPCLRANHHNTEDIHYILVYGQTKSTSTPVKSTGKTLEEENSMEETSQQLIPITSPTMTSWLGGFLAKHSLLQVKEQDLMTPEELSFLKSQGFSETKDPDVYYSKTSKAYYLMTLARLSKPYLKYSPTLGIELNGRYLILKTSEFRRTGNECSLSDILEEEVEDKYFLSDVQTEKIAESFVRPSGRHITRAVITNPLSEKELKSADSPQPSANDSKASLTDGQKG